MEKVFIKDEWLVDENNVKCPLCEKICRKKGFFSHYYRKHMDKNYDTSIHAWNKGLNKNNCNSILIGSKKLKDGFKNGTIKVWCQNKHLSDEHKKKISDKMKIIHQQGKHPGWKHINGDIKRRSYPEKFFIDIFNNNKLFDKYKIVEKMPFGKYFLDFAFPELLLDLEIDGDQHYRNKENIEHDTERDLYVKQLGWNVYRIKWKNICNDSKKEIKKFLACVAQLDERRATNAD